MAIPKMWDPMPNEFCGPCRPRKMAITHWYLLQTFKPILVWYMAQKLFCILNASPPLTNGINVCFSWIMSCASFILNVIQEQLFNNRMRGSEILEYHIVKNIHCHNQIQTLTPTLVPVSRYNIVILSLNK